MKAVDVRESGRTVQLHYGSHRDRWLPAARWNDAGSEPFLIVTLLDDGRGPEFYLDVQSAVELAQVLLDALAERGEVTVTHD